MIVTVNQKASTRSKLSAMLTNSSPKRSSRNGTTFQGKTSKWILMLAANMVLTEAAKRPEDVFVHVRQVEDCDDDARSEVSGKSHASHHTSGFAVPVLSNEDSDLLMTATPYHPETSVGTNKKRALIVTISGNPNDDDFLRSVLNDGIRMVKYYKKLGFTCVWLRDFIPEVHFYKKGQGLAGVREVRDRTNSAFSAYNYNPDKYIDADGKIAEQDIREDFRNILPNENNLIRELKLMVEQSVAGDNCALFYSGHGGLGGSLNPFKNINSIWLGKHVSRDVIYNNFTSKLVSGVNAVEMWDCCHSGSMGKLRYRLLETGDDPWGKPKTKDDISARVISISACNDNELSTGDKYVNAFLQTVGFFGQDDCTARDAFRGRCNLRLPQFRETVRTKMANKMGKYKTKENGKMTMQIEASHKFLLDQPLEMFFRSSRIRISKEEPLGQFAKVNRKGKQQPRLVTYEGSKLRYYDEGKLKKYMKRATHYLRQEDVLVIFGRKFKYKKSGDDEDEGLGGVVFILSDDEAGAFLAYLDDFRVERIMAQHVESPSFPLDYRSKKNEAGWIKALTKTSAAEFVKKLEK